MKLGEVYKLKDNNKYYLPEKILIDSFATKHYKENNDFKYNTIIVVAVLDDSMTYTSPSFNVYFDNAQEVLEDYDLLMSQEDHNKYLI
jgi:hypothetical protein